MRKFRDSLLAAAGLTVLLVNLTLLTSRAGRTAGPGGPVPVASVYEPGLHPFQYTLSSDKSFTVPAHQRLVIDTVDGLFTTMSRPLLAIELTTQTNGSPFPLEHTFPVTFQGNPLLTYYAVTQRVQLYADPETSVKLRLVTSDAFAGGGIVISGHLVDVP